MVHATFDFLQLHLFLNPSPPKLHGTSNENPTSLRKMHASIICPGQKLFFGFTAYKSKCSSAVRVQWIWLTFLGSRHPVQALGGLAPSRHCLSGSCGPSQKSNRKSGKSRLSNFLFCYYWKQAFFIVSVATSLEFKSTRQKRGCVITQPFTTCYQTLL